MTNDTIENPNSLVTANAGKGSNSTEVEIDLYALFLKLMEKWYLILIVGFVFAFAFLIYTIKYIPVKYSATSKLYIVNSDSAINLSDLQLSNYLAEDYVEVFYSWELHEAVLKEFEDRNQPLDYTYDDLQDMLSINNPSNTRLLYITITSTDPQEAHDLANVYAEVAREYIVQKMKTSEPTMFEQAEDLPYNPVSPNNAKNTIMGFIVGAFLTCAFIVVMFLRDDYIRTAEDVDKYLRVPLLGSIMLQQDLFDTKNKNNKEKK